MATEEDWLAIALLDPESSSRVGSMVASQPSREHGVKSPGVSCYPGSHCWHVAAGGAEDPQVAGLEGGVDGGAVHDQGGDSGHIGDLSGSVVGVVDQQLGLGGHVGGVCRPGIGLRKPDQALEAVDAGGDECYIVRSTNGGDVDSSKIDTKARGVGGVENSVVDQQVLVHAGNPTLLHPALVVDGAHQGLLILDDGLPSLEA